jgi:hypothetical protein|tara:strand:+ start:59 stop:448 length:390 start_codon:yes stop_codon:yes gene_type:complete
MSYLSTFTNYIQEFIDKFCDCYPEDTDLSNFKTYILILKKTNPRKILELFDKYCVKYKTQIKNKDEEFLLTANFIKDKIKIEHIINENNSFDIIEKIRNYWREMDNEMKENIWKYLNLFLMLSTKINKT